MRWIRRMWLKIGRSERVGRMGALNRRCDSLQKQRDDALQEVWRLRRECNYQTETVAYLRAKLADQETRAAVFSE